LHHCRFGCTEVIEDLLPIEKGRCDAVDFVHLLTGSQAIFVGL